MTFSLLDAPTLLRDQGNKAVTQLFRAMAQARQAPAVHARGVAFHAQVIVSEPSAFPLSEGRYEAMARLSKGAGTPDGRTDVLGLGLRIYPPDGPAWDVLLSSAGQGWLTRWLPLPARSWTSARYSTLTPYEANGTYTWLRAVPEGPEVGHASTADLSDRSPAGFGLSVGGPSGGWSPIGRLVLGEPSDELNKLVLDPVLNQPPDGRPAPRWLTHVRELAYLGSRLGRDAGPPTPS